MADDDDIESDATVSDGDGRSRDFEIMRVITIVEVKQPDGNIGVRVRAQFLPWVALGMLELAKKTVEAGMGS
jgi:hypothetical protein